MAKHSGISRRNRFQASLLANEAVYRAKLAELPAVPVASAKIAGVAAAGAGAAGLASLPREALAFGAISWSF
jgi:hypothetical protein